MSGSDLTNALSDFRQGLSSEQEDRLDKIASTTPGPEDVVQLTDEINKKNSERKSRILASRVNELLVSVQQYCTIVDTCAGPNQIAALVWGSVKILILVALNFSERFEKLSKKIAQLSTYCPRLSEYNKLFRHSLRLQDALSNFYAIVVFFCSKALVVVQGKGAKMLSQSLWKPYKADFAEIEEKLDATREEVKEEIQLASEQAADGFRQLQMIEMKESQTYRLQQVAEIEQNRNFRAQQWQVTHESQARQIQKLINSEERSKIRLLRKISNYNYTRSLRNAQASRCEGTCLWLLRRAEYKEWINREPPGCISCYGTPGCGKTILMGYVIDSLATDFSIDKDSAVVYYFFTYSYRESLAMTTFVRCILHQIIRVEALLPNVRRRLEAIFDGLTDQWEPNVIELEKIFIELCGTLKKVFLLIDGLDELDQNNRKLVFRFLRSVQDKTCARIFVTTHPEVDMLMVLNRCRRLQISRQDLEADIERFVKSEMKTYSLNELSTCPPVLLSSIEKALISKAEGMFLWVDLQIKVICSAYEEDGTPNRIPELLESLPKGIMEIYSSTLTRLSSEGDRQIELARNVFQWVIWARKPMKISELEEAIAITTDQRSWNAPSIKLSPSKLSKICGNLISLDGFEHTISLAHHTVLDFLLSCSEIPSVMEFQVTDFEAERRLAEICTTYLSFVDFRTSLIPTTDTRNLERLNRPLNLVSPMLPASLRTRFPGFRNQRIGENRMLDLTTAMRAQISAYSSSRVDPSFLLLDYCKTYWHDHCRYFSLDDRKLVISLKRLILGPDLPFKWKPWSSYSGSESLPHWSMFYWAISQFHPLVLYIWQDSVSKTEAAEYWKQLWSKDGITWFTAVCTAPHIELLDIILRALKGEQFMRRPSHDEVSVELANAASLGHIHVVERLLQENTDVNAATATAAAKSKGRTALQAAAEGGHLAVVERLLQEKADINAAAAKYNGRTALQAAAEGGHLAVVERLLQEKADVNAVAADRRTAAAQGDYLAAVERLLQENAGVSAAAAAFSGGRTALQAAAEGGHLAVVERLLQEKADINTAAALSGGRTALQAAAQGGHLAVVERLLQEKADINAAAAEYNGRTALQAAAEGGHLAVVERLLQEKADVNAASVYDGRTVLQAAAEGGHLAVVERLLQEKADVNAASVYDGRTALQAAAEGSHLPVVERLLQEKADVNAVAGNGRTALQAAAERGYLAVVERLLQENADVNAVAGDGRTALQVAAESGHLPVVERLLQEKVDVNAVARDGRTALQTAAGNGHLAVAKRLRAAGAR